jgi:uncharacterized protein YegJ (DUF2314 family)
MRNFSLIILFICLGCNSQNKTERENEPTIYNVESEDVEINRAIKTAKQTLTKFEKAIRSNNTNFSLFALKVKFENREKAEHIWLSNVEFKNGEYFGVVDNLPEHITEVKLGETLKIENKTITDWMYLDNSKLVGGYTIRVLRDRMSEVERKQFDLESGMKF